MSTITPFSADDARLMWHVLARWTKVLEGNTRSRLLTGWIKDNYRSAISAEALENVLPKTPSPLKSYTMGWIVGAPLTRAEHVIPIVTVSLGKVTDGQFEGLAIRVALIHERPDGTMVAEGWRFEQGELDEEDGTHPAHPYAHAQAIIGWTKGSDCLLHPPHAATESCLGIDTCADEKLDGDRKTNQGLTLVKHPAFPLGVQTMTGVALSVICTLYGNPGAEKLTRGDTMLRAASGPIQADLSLLQLRTR